MESPAPSENPPSSRFARLCGEYALPVLFGSLTFFLVMGGGILDPRNIAWMAHFDPAQDYLGWAFFRDTPWMIPPGANPRYGLEVGSSIFYSDSIPLLALPAKLLSPWLPVPFQYWGWWVLLSLNLQAWFGWKLSGLITPDRLARVMGMGLFVFAPPFLYRLNFHYSFAGQWLLLASLYLTFGPRGLRRTLWWPLLGFIAAGIHPYLFAMVFFLWCADMARRLIARVVELPTLTGEISAFIGGSLLMLWLGGFFLTMGGGLRSWGLGNARMDLLSLINPSNFPISGKWSYLLPALPTKDFDYEGFNYLGLGLIVLFTTCFALLVTEPRLGQPSRKWWPLLLLLGGLGIFALSNKVSVAGVTFFQYPMPSILEMFQCSGRMFWPVFYALIFAGLVYSYRRLGPDGSLLLWGMALILQILDTSAGWKIVHLKTNAEAGPAWASPFHADLWNQAAPRYRTIYRLPFQGYPDSGYQHVAYYALQHNLGTDAAYLARYDQGKLKAHREKLNADLASGHFNPQALYILDDAHAELARKSLNPATDALEKIDGFWVLAPGWKSPSP